jgi:hypothetical protein
MKISLRIKLIRTKVVRSRLMSVEKLNSRRFGEKRGASTRVPPRAALTIRQASLAARILFNS